MTILHDPCLRCEHPVIDHDAEGCATGPCTCPRPFQDVRLSDVPW